MNEFEVDTKLNDLDRHFESKGEALALLLMATQAINEAEEPNRERRIREWLEKLVEGVRNIARLFEARGFSVTVGFPAGVSVTVDWGLDRP